MSASVHRFAVTYDRRAERVLDPSWIVRLVARVRRRALDRALIDGADPTTSAQLAARAVLLTTRSMRTELADGIQSLMQSTNRRLSRRRVLPTASAVLANTTELGELAALLRGPAPLYARGVAMLRELLSDGTGPVYTDRQGTAIAHCLRETRAAIVG